MSPSKHQFFDVTFSIYQSGESKKESKGEKRGKAAPTEDYSHSIVTFDNYSSEFHRILSFDQHNMVGGGVKET